MEKITTMPTLQYAVTKAVEKTKITDIHTHIFPLCFNNLLHYGIDDLLTYDYLITEFFRNSNISYEAFFEMTKDKQAELVWQALFINNTPVSEATRSLITIFKKLGLDVNRKDIGYFREYFSSLSPHEHLNRVLEISNVDSLVMTNNPLNEEERRIWESQCISDNRFYASLRLDPVLNSWDESFLILQDMGYQVDKDLNDSTISEISRFLREWIDKMNAVYCSVSLPHHFSIFDSSPSSRIIEECVVPVCRDKNIPFTLMMGVKPSTNPLLRDAGDALGIIDIASIEYLCSKYPKNKFLVTLLSYQYQHEIVVLSNKFRNLMLFGCWWFLNNPSMIETITKFRLELLGSSFIPQHSDSKVLEDILSKWDHFKYVIVNVLIHRYRELINCGYTITFDSICTDVKKLLRDNFWEFLDLRLK